MFQDWTDVVITKKKPAAGTTMSADAVRLGSSADAAARRRL